MIIEITGIFLPNRGSDLMARAIVAHYQGSQPSAQLCLAPERDYLERAGLGVLQKVPFLGRRTQWAVQLMPPPVRSLFGLVTESQVNVVLDASGFAYSDQWGPRASKLLAGAAAAARARGARTILLPQAFGPFEQAPVREAFIAALRNVDLVFARDRQSEAYLRGLGVRGEVIRRSPDFTNLISGVLPDWDSPSGPYACLVPNYRMIDRAGDRTGGHLRFLMDAIRALRDRDIEPVLLLHGDHSDERLARELVDKCGPLRRVPWFNGVQLKGIIRQSRLVLGSRFHALVSGLSQAVPCIGAGWSHKYAELFADYAADELLLAADATLPVIEHALTLAVDRRSELVARLAAAGEAQRQLARAMWQEVDQLLGVTTLPAPSVSQVPPGHQLQPSPP